jgi:acetyl-CoA acetyltransferase family protein
VDEVVRRTKIAPELVDDVIVGCVSQVGAQSGNIGRSIVLSSSVLPITVPGTSVDRQCGSGQQAIHFAAQAVMSGTQDIVIAGGVESMTLVPIGASVMDGLQNGHGHPQGEEIKKKWDVQFSQFMGAELMCKKYRLTRDSLDQLAFASHMKAAAAIKGGYFKREIVPLKGHDAKGEEVVHDQDEGVRPGAKLDQMKSLKPLSDKPGAMITAATSSQICDGSAALMVVNERGLARVAAAGGRARARIVTMALAGTDPVVMLSGPIPAAQRALKQAGLTIDDMDLYEVNEAFASVPQAWVQELKADPRKLNVNGGACALGHPLGATGVKLMTTLVHELERRGARYGMLAICEGGGTANATIIERCNPDGSPIAPTLRARL